MELQGPDTRRRSRSKTPSTLRKSVDKDVGGDGERKTVRKIPNVITITEEEIPGLDELGENVIIRVTRQSTKIITSDYSSDDGVESAQTSLDAVQEQPQKVVAETNGAQVTSSVTTSQRIVVKSATAESASSSSKTTSKTSASKATVASNETQLNDLTRFIDTNLRTSTPKVKSSTSSVKKSVKVLTNGDNSNSSSEHIAYREYSDAGEYWNKVPKTDYTYSKLSPHRKELSDGFVSMPNMSRSSVKRHEERVSGMIRSNPQQESYIRERYQTMATRPFTQTGYTSLVSEDRTATSFGYDSQDEVDFAQFERRRANYNTRVVHQHQETLIRRVFLTIITTLYDFSHSITRMFSRSEHNLYYTRLDEDKSWYTRLFNYVSGGVLSLFRYFYLFITSILYLDCWLLQSRNNSDQKKRFLLLLLILLPLLLLGAWLLADDNQRTILLSYLPLTATATTTSTLFALPLTALSSVKQYIPDWNNKFPDIDFNLSWLRMPSTSEWFTASSTSSQYNKLDSSLRGALSADEYTKLLAHIEQYIDRKTADKLQLYGQMEQERMQKNSKQSSDEITAHITTLVRESFHHYKYELTDSDCDRIAEKVRRQIEVYVDGKFKVFGAEQSAKDKEKVVEPFAFTDANIKEIQAIINQSFVTKNYQLKVETPAVDGVVDVESILLKVLKSPQLKIFVDEKLVIEAKANEAKFAKLSALIDEIRNDVKGVGVQVAENVASNAGLVADLSTLHAKQENLSNEFVELRAAQSKKIDLVLNEMNLQLAKHNEQQFLRLDEQIRLIVLEILGYGDAATADVDIKDWIKSIFVAKEYLEVRLGKLNLQTDAKIQEEVQKSAAIFMQEISKKIKQEVLIVVHDGQKATAATQTAGARVKAAGSISEDEVRRIVREALAVYDADKTGLVDYALESAGGQVLSTRCTESFQAKSAQISIFGIPLWYPTNTPRTAITPAVQPGQCWAFQGFPGFLVIQLNKPVLVTGFTLEHIPKILSPNGKIDSAPNNFSVWGLRQENDPEPALFGKYQFLDIDSNLQHFPVQNTKIDQTYQIVELRIESNLGNSEYTCLYRFRVHGQPN